MKQKMDDYTAGELRNRVSVERATLSPDGSGGQTKVWAEVAVIWCFVKERSANERYGDSALGRLRTVADWEFTTWFRTDIGVEDRLVWDGRFWNIRKVEDVLKRGKWTRITAEAGVEI